MGTGSTRVRVQPTKLGTWEVIELGGTRALVTTPDKLITTPDKLTATQRAALQLRRGGTVDVLDVNGVITATHQVPPPPERPWWYSPPGSWAWVLPLLLLLQPMLGLPTRNYTQPLWWLYMVILVFSVAGVVAVFCSRSRDRRIARDATRPMPDVSQQRDPTEAPDRATE